MDDGGYMGWLSALLTLVLLACGPMRGGDDVSLPDFDAALAVECPLGAAKVVEEGLAMGCADDVGLPHGPFFGYYESGHRRSYGEYVHGEIQGWIVLWHEAGALKSAGREEGGSPVGEWRWWDPDGSLRKKHSFDVEPASTPAG